MSKSFVLSALVSALLMGFSEKAQSQYGCPLLEEVTQS